MKTRALLSVLGASVVLLGAAGAAHADGNQVIPGSDIVQTETYGFDADGNYQAEDRDNWRDLDSDSPAELYERPTGNTRVFGNSTADPKGCFDDNDPSDCTGGALSGGAELRRVARVAARLDSDGTAEIYVEDDSRGGEARSAINELAYTGNPDYTTAGDDDDGHNCGNAQGHCDDETNVVVSLP